MRNQLIEWTKAFAEKNGLTVTGTEDEGAFTLEVEAVPVRIAAEEGSGMVVVQAAVGLFPDAFTPAEQVSFYRFLLDANNLFGDTKGFTLGTDAEVELITLQYAAPFASLDAEIFGNILTNFLKATAEWLGKLEEWRPAAAEGDSSFPSGKENFLQV